MKLERSVYTDAARVVWAIRNSGSFVFGNGGSAAIANHMECDITKSTDGKTRVVSLCANSSMLTAIGNDLGYDETCATQLRWRNSGTRPNRVILISSSGTSKNIVKAAKQAKAQGAMLIGFTGFDGGPLKKLADISIHIDSKDYGEIEDYHSNVMHEIVRQLKELK